MDNKPDKSNRTLILYFALSIIFALLAVLTSKAGTLMYYRALTRVTVNLHWLFWLCMAISVGFVLPIVYSLLRSLHEHHRLPKPIEVLFSEEVVSKLTSTMRAVRLLIYGTGGRLLLAGSGIILLTIFIWKSGVIHETELASNLFTIVDVAGGRYSGLPMAESSTVEPLFLIRSTEDDYLRDCLKLVRELKAAGAKVVVLRMTIPPMGRKVYQALKELEATGIVVFATSSGLGIRVADSSGEMKLSMGTRTMRDREVEETYRLTRLMPSGTRGLNTFPLLDVSMEIVRKYRDYGAEVQGHLEGNYFVFGEYRIPVTTDGWMYSRDKGLMRHPHLGAYLEEEGKSIQWLDERKLSRQELRVPKFSIPPSTSISLEELSSALQGKIIIIMESLSPPVYQAVSRSYASAVENILEGTVLRKWETGHIWFALVSLLLAGFVVHRVRTALAILILLSFLPGVLLAAYYFYANQNILIDVFYTLLAIGIAIVTFPGIAQRNHPGNGFR